MVTKAKHRSIFLAVQQFFGERWDAPAFDDAVAVEVPVGEICRLCEEPIGESDSGILMGYIDGRGKGSISPIHIECHLRSVLGSVAHLEGRCSCATGRHADDRSNLTWREQGQLVVEWVYDRRGL